MKARAGRLRCTHYSRDMYVESPLLTLEEALTALRQANIVRRDPREEKFIKLERVETSKLKNGNRTRTFLERSATMKALLKVIGVLGVSLVMAGMCQISSIEHVMTGLRGSILKKQC